MPDDPASAGAPPGRRLLRCGQCGRSDEVTHADLMTFTRAGWPRCCGGVMGSFVEARPPTAIDHTDPERPAIPPPPP